MSRISAPVCGVYGEKDARITATVPDVGKAMKAAGILRFFGEKIGK